MGGSAFSKFRERGEGVVGPLGLLATLAVVSDSPEKLNDGVRGFLEC